MSLMSTIRAMYAPKEITESVQQEQPQLEEGYKEQEEQYRAEAVKQAQRILAAVNNENLSGCKYISRSLQDMADDMETRIEYAERETAEYGMKEEVEQIEEATHRVVGVTHSGEKFKSGLMTKKAADDKHWNMTKAKDKSGKSVYKSIQVVKEEDEQVEEGYVVKYHTAKGEHKNTSKVFDNEAAAKSHADRGNSVDKVGGKYTVHKIGSKGHEVKEEVDEAKQPHKFGDTWKSYDAIKKVFHRGFDKKDWTPDEVASVKKHVKIAGRKERGLHPGTGPMDFSAGAMHDHIVKHAKSVKEEVEIEEAAKPTVDQISKVLDGAKDTKQGLAALMKAFKVDEKGAKKLIQSTLGEAVYHVSYGTGLDHQVVAKSPEDAHQKAMAHFKKKKPKLNDPEYADTFKKKAVNKISEDVDLDDEFFAEGWDDMMKAVKDRAKPQPNGGAGKKAGRAYGGANQKDDKKKQQDEALSPKQKQLDVDKDGDIEGDDLKALRDKKKKPGTSGKAEPVEVNPKLNEETDFLNELLEGSEMTDAEMKKREEIVKSMKKKTADFKSRYGDRWKSVMYATATKMANK